MLAIKNSTTLKDIEESLQQIIANPGKPLKVSKDFLSRRVGALHDVARLQLMVTWARHAENEYIHYDRQVKLGSLLDELCKSAAGITALRLSRGIMSGDQTIDRRDALVPAANKMELTDQERYSEVIKGRTIDLISVSGSRIQYLRPLFNERSPKAVKSDVEMSKTFSKIIAEINKKNDNVPRSLINSLGIFAHELFKNTQEHATTDHLYRPLKCGHVEGITVSWDQLLEDQVANDFQGHERLREFWEREKRITGDTDKRVSVRCLQISFFDSGPGFVSRSTGKIVTDLTPEDELNELIKCLQKNVSSKVEKGSGQGLPNVLTVLQKIGGVIRIRSGRKCIFNAFSENDESTDRYSFQDWFGPVLSPIEGASITIIIPLRKAS